MKTGEEKFDDEIRQKLRHTEIKPPADLFDTIVPPKNKKRGFFWIWLSGIAVLVLSVIGMQFLGDKHDIKSRKSTNSETNSTNRSENHEYNGNSNNAKKDLTEQSHENILRNGETGLPTNNSSLNKSERTGTQTASSQSSSDASINDSPDVEASIKANKKGRNNNITGKENSDQLNYYYASRKQEPGNNIYNYDILYTPVPALPYESNFEIKQQLRIIKPDTRPLYMHRPTPFSIEISAVYNNINQSLKSSAEDTLALRLFESGKASMDISGGWGMNGILLYALNEKLTVSAGIGFSKHNESMQMNFVDYKKEMFVDSLVYYILFPFLPPLQVVEYDSTIFYIPQQHDINHQLTFKTFSFNAGVGYSIPVGTFNIEPGVNFIVDLFTQVSGNSNFNPAYSEVKGNDYYDQSIQYGISANLLLGYSASEKITIFVNPAYRYDFTSLKTNPSFYKNRNNVMSVGCGVRYAIFKKHNVKINMSGPDIVKN